MITETKDLKSKDAFYTGEIRLTDIADAEDYEISQERAIRILRNHGCGNAACIREMFAQLGLSESYNLAKVLEFLGY